jgi:hypothetical protein
MVVLLVKKPPPPPPPCMEFKGPLCGYKIPIFGLIPNEFHAVHNPSHDLFSIYFYIFPSASRLLLIIMNELIREDTFISQ